MRWGGGDYKYTDALINILIVRYYKLATIKPSLTANEETAGDFFFPNPPLFFFFLNTLVGGFSVWSSFISFEINCPVDVRYVFCAPVLR